MGYGLISNVSDAVNHPLSFFHATLAVSNEDTLIGYDEHANRRKSLFARRPELFV
jgi:hypothetical protein